VGAACSRDLFNSRLQAAPTGVFLGYLSLPDKRILFFTAEGVGLAKAATRQAGIVE